LQQHFISRLQAHKNKVRCSRTFQDKIRETKGPITWSIFNPGVELSPVNRVEIFCDYMDDFNPGVETLYSTFSASIRGSKKSLYFVFL
jgi:hypothetical protein